MASFGAHRQDDLRTCGAKTVVVGQSSVFVNNKLWAVEGDVNTDGEGQLIAGGKTVYVENKLVIVHAPDDAEPDLICPSKGGPGPDIHCNPQTAQGSDDLILYHAS